MIATVVASPNTPQWRHSHAVGGTPSICLRAGTLGDLDSLLDIGLAAMPMDPQWDYRFPYRRSFPCDQREATKRRYREFLENGEGRWSVVVAEMVEGSRLQQVAFAVWDICHLNTTPIPSPQKTSTCGSIRCARRDGDQSRMQAWNHILNDAKTRHFERRFGNRQIQLQILATHPDFQRLGAGTLLVCDGIRFAEASNKAISVFASPLGKRLYSTLGFKTIETVIVRVREESEFVSVEAMGYEPIALASARKKIDKFE